MALSREDGYGLGFGVALRALVPVLDWMEHGGESVRAWLGWSSRFLAFSMLFGAFLCWNVAFVREGLSDGLSCVGPDELSGLPCESV